MVRVRSLLWLLPAAVSVMAQGDLPDLSTATQATALSTESSSAASTSGATSSAASSETSSGASSAATTSSAASSETSSGSATVTFTGGSSSTVGGLLTGLPTIAGAGVPDMVIPYTANAPFMQKSTLPEGTVFIAVGAVLAFLGACVLLWRILVAWSINRSVKRSATAAMRTGTEKSSAWGGSTKNAYYKEYEAGSSMSLDALTSAGKPIRNSHIPDDKRHSSAPPAGLFFSPTAQASNRASSAGIGMEQHRGSGYMPAGYYAAPSATDPAGGRGSVALGSSLSPYARHSTVDPSPPGTPGLPNSRSTSNYYGGTPGVDSRAGLRAYGSRENLRMSSRDGSNLRPGSRDAYGSRPNSHMYASPSTSSLQVGMGLHPAARGSSEHLAGQRAPSAVLDELFENHGHGPRERF